MAPLFPPAPDFQVTLPPGANFTVNWGLAAAGGSFVRVCDPEANPVHFFNLEGSETGRVVNDPSVNPVLDEIVRGIRVGQLRTPPSGEPQFTPPDTGNAGLMGFGLVF